MCLIRGVIDLLFWKSNSGKQLQKKTKQRKNINIYVLESLLLISSVNHRVLYVERQTAAFIMAATRKMTRGVSCDWLLKCIPAAVAGWARKVAVTVGQSASSGLDLFNELTCSCWQH